MVALIVIFECRVMMHNQMSIIFLTNYTLDYVCIGKTPGNYQGSKAIQCATYYACANNVGTKQTCPSNTKFFNRVTRACQADAPDGQNCVSTG